MKKGHVGVEIRIWDCLVKEAKAASMFPEVSGDVQNL